MLDVPSMEGLGRTQEDCKDCSYEQDAQCQRSSSIAGTRLPDERDGGAHCREAGERQSDQHHNAANNSMRLNEYVAPMPD